MYFDQLYNSFSTDIQKFIKDNNAATKYLNTTYTFDPNTKSSYDGSSILYMLCYFCGCIKDDPELIVHVNYKIKWLISKGADVHFKKGDQCLIEVVAISPFEGFMKAGIIKILLKSGLGVQEPSSDIENEKGYEILDKIVNIWINHRNDRNDSGTTSEWRSVNSHIIMAFIEHKYKNVEPIRIDEGSNIYQMEDKRGNKIAMKQAPIYEYYDDYPDFEYIQKEIKILKLLNHPNIIQIIDSTSLYFTMELAETDLEHLLYDCWNNNNKMSLWLNNSINQFKIMKQLASAVHYLHSQKKIIHRDLKTANILIFFKNNELIAKIADFEDSIIMDLDKNKSSCDNNDYKIDIWSLGVIFYYILAYIHIKKHEEIMDLYFYEVEITPGYEEESQEITYKIINSISMPNTDQNNQLKDLLKNMLYYDKKYRYNSEQVLNHPYFQ